MSISPPKTITSWVLLIVLALIWGSSFLLMGIGLKVFTPLQVASIRIVSASIALAGIALPAFWHIKREKWFLAFLSGILGVFIPAFLFAYALTNLNMAVTGILNAMTPLFTVLIGVIFFTQKVGNNTWVGMMIGFIGSVILTVTSRKGGFEVSIYPFLVLIATICYALNGNLSKSFMQDIPPLYLTAMSQAWIGILAIPVLLNSGLSEQWNAPMAFETIELKWLGISGQARWISLGSLIFLGISSTAIAMVIFNKLMQMTSIIFASTVTYLIPIVAMGWEIASGGYITLLQSFCMLLIIGGVYITNNSKK